MYIYIYGQLIFVNKGNSINVTKVTRYPKEKKKGGKKFQNKLHLFLLICYAKLGSMDQDLKKRQNLKLKH